MSANAMESGRKKPGLCCSTRLYVALQILLGIMVLHIFRGSMGVTLVCMTSARNSRHLPNVNGSSPTTTNQTTHDSDEELYNLGTEFDYDKSTQGYILGSFFLLNWLAALPGGWLAGKYGGKIVLGWSVLLCSLMSLVAPLAARIHVGFFITTRVVMGFLQGVTWPATEVVLLKWAPPLERTIICGLSVIGHCFGNVIGNIMSGVLCAYGFDEGWASCFYIYGAMGIAWFLVMMTTVYESPNDQPKISENERKYIVDSLKTIVNVSEKVKDVPIQSILRSMPVWSLIVDIACTDWGTFMISFNIPSYMKEIQHLGILQNGIFAALPFAGYTLITMLSMYIPDFLRRRQYMSTTNVRKLFNTMGTFLPAVFFILASMYDVTPTLGVLWLIMGQAASGCFVGGVLSANTIDIAGRYTGVVMGLVIVMEGFVGIITPLAVGYLTSDETREQWHMLFQITSGVYMFGGMFYLVFGSGELQQWAAIKDIDQEISVKIKS